MAAMDKQALKLRNLRAGQSELAQRRALELGAQKPQLLVFDNEPKPIEGVGAYEGGEKGISRLVGRRRKAKSGAGGHESSSDSECECHGGASCECESKMSGGSRKKMPKKLEGAGGGVQQMAHARMASGGLPGAARTGAFVPPGGVAPVAYGNPPQAPKGFQRNGVMLDRAARGEKPSVRGGAGGAPAGGAGGAPAGGAAPSAASKRAERGRKIAMIMREKGMTLPQASAWLKAHGSE